ncbi:MAG: 2-phospho-L-lactate transferase [Gammaproteobacteria bacterium]|nr:2-phospho-L-lactate transferase [Gammaproteobacteria bacterium]
MNSSATVLAISGGVGGAKLALGLAHTVNASELAVLVNTGDDFTHLGFRICPDLDTVLYTLGGVVHPTQGWGRADETFGFMVENKRQGGPDWFSLGDRDLVLHAERTRALQAGESLSVIMARLAQRFGLASQILPMSDSTVATMLETNQGRLAFQDYFVRLRCVPSVRKIVFDGATEAVLSPDFLTILASGTLEAIILCPSNPYLSIDPILAVPGLRDALRATGVPIVAVSPLIFGRAVKGPTAKIMQELGVPVTTESILRHYEGFIDALVLDTADSEQVQSLPIPCAITDILMTTLADKQRVAGCALALSKKLRGRV